MVSLTINIEEDKLKSLENFNWVNWSELARIEIRKKVIFEKYIKTKEMNAEDSKFCDEIDWHPVDELPLKKSFIKELKSMNGKHSKAMSPEEFKKFLGKI